jgi:hypothetical protein
VDLGSSDVERGELLALRALDERRAGDHHVRLLGHVDAVADDRHVAAARDAIAEHAAICGTPAALSTLFIWKMCPAPVRPGKLCACSGKEETRAIDEVDDRHAQPERHRLRALDLFRRERPPGAARDRVVVRDHDDPAIRDPREDRVTPAPGRLLLRALERRPQFTSVPTGRIGAPGSTSARSAPTS